jgi:hypothetical protein
LVCGGALTLFVIPAMYVLFNARSPRPAPHPVMTHSSEQEPMFSSPLSGTP